MNVEHLQEDENDDLQSQADDYIANLGSQTREADEHDASTVCLESHTRSVL